MMTHLARATLEKGEMRDLLEHLFLFARPFLSLCCQFSDQAQVRNDPATVGASVLSGKTAVSTDARQGRRRLLGPPSAHGWAA